MLVMDEEASRRTRSRAEILCVEQDGGTGSDGVLRSVLRHPAHLVRAPHSKVDIPFVELEGDVADAVRDIPANNATLEDEKMS